MPATRPVTVIHGSSKHPNHAARFREELETAQLAGTLIIGYPPGVDAVLVSEAGHVTVFHLDPGTGENAVEEQDMAWLRIDQLLAAQESLRKGRQRLVVPQSVTVAHAARAKGNTDDPEHPVITPGRVLDTLREYHSRPVPGPPADHDTVVEAVLRMPQAL